MEVLYAGSGGGGEITFNTAANSSAGVVEAMRIDENGNVGIGTTSPASQDASANNLVISDTAGNGGLTINTPTNAIGAIHFSDGTSGADRYRGIISYGHSDNSMRFHTNTARAMTIDSSGNLLVGTATASISATNNTGAVIVPNGASQFSRDGGHTLDINRVQDGEIVRFRSAGNIEGSISISGSTTSYNTSSDQRLKDNIVDAPSASDDIDAIQVRSFDWKADGSHQKYGMVAQELQTVAPEAVSAPEDPEEMMGVDYSKLVPMMLKEIQSLRARIAALES